MKTVLVLGGYGGFGSRLCRRLDGDGWHVIVAGRDRAKAEAFAATLASAHGIAVDRTADLGPVLAAHTPALVIDAAGPFQGSDYRVPEACIARAIPYLDLADARDFVCRIGALDEAATAAGVAVIAGASSVPALSGAVIRHLTDSCDQIDRTDIAITASDKAVAGTSVATAMLSYVGKPVRAWQGKRWIGSPGWQGAKRLRLTAHGTPRLSRLVARADVPDLDIWPRTLPGEPATHFHAGPEFGFQVCALSLLAWLVRWGWLSSLTPLAPLLRPLQGLTRRFSDGRSAMVVQVCARSGDRIVKRRWELLAKDGHGPEIPVLAAQLLARKVASGTLAAGARSAHAVLAIEDFDAAFAELGISCRIAEENYEPLYRRALGPAAFDRLPIPVRALHQVCGDGGAHGEGTVERGRGLLAKLIGAFMRFPPAGAYRVHVSFTEEDGRETWTRDFGGHCFYSEVSLHRGCLTERFGPMRFGFELPTTESGLEMRITRWSAFGIPMPLALAPRIAASETVRDGKFAFDVGVAMPLIGKVVHYRGTLSPL